MLLGMQHTSSNIEAEVVILRNSNCHWGLEGMGYKQKTGKEVQAGLQCTHLPGAARQPFSSASCLASSPQLELEIGYATICRTHWGTRLVRQPSIIHT